MRNVAIRELSTSNMLALPGQDELPYDDGEPMETVFHDAQDALLKDSLLFAWRGRQDVFVAGNMFVYYSPHQVRNNDFRGPDVFVVLNTVIKERKSWVVWEEDGKLPDVVIEVISESTEHVDRGEKMYIYSKIWRTPAYFLFDPDTEILEGFSLDPATLEYARLAPDARGDLPVAPLGLKLGLRPTKFRRFDRDFVRWLQPDGTPLPTPEEQADRIAARADEERARADEERARADEERARADEERARADEERARAEAALERVRELEAQLAATHQSTG